MDTFKIVDSTPQASPIPTYPIPIWPEDDATPTAIVTDLPATGFLPSGDSAATWVVLVVVLAFVLIGGAVVLRRRANRV